MMREKWQANNWQIKTGLECKWIHNLTPGWARKQKVI